MADCCQVFPTTVDEFMEQYKIIDTEHVYTNGSALVPIFRMQQWFDQHAEGTWLPYEFGDYHWHKCSACGIADKFIETVKREGSPDVDVESVRNFCPHCGAKMKGR